MRPNSAAAKRGFKHEEKAHRQLTELYGLSYFNSIWFAYCDGLGKVRYCQFDGLLADHKRRNLTIVECKLKHTAEAFWQIENLYMPVLRAWLTDEGKRFWSLCACEVVKWYDPHTQFPAHPVLVETLDLVRCDRFNVHIL